MPTGVIVVLIIQTIICGGVFGVAMWAYKKGMPLKWYELLLVVLGLLLGGLTVQFVLNTGMLIALVLLIPALIFLLVAWQLIVNRQRAGINKQHHLNDS